jgi:hypothetical protein
MAESTVYKYYKDLPSWAKGVVVVGVLGLTYIVGNKIFNALKPKPQEIKNVEDDIKILQNKQKQTYNDSAYDGYAETIYQAQRTSMSNDSGTILDTAKLMKNDLDVALLVRAYGIRQDYAFAIPVDKYSLFGAMRKGIESDLFGAYSFRIGTINNDWESKGITYRI